MTLSEMIYEARMKQVTIMCLSMLLALLTLTGMVVRKRNRPAGSFLSMCAAVAGGLLVAYWFWF